jgi:tryptophan synthase alpha chain
MSKRLRKLFKKPGRKKIFSIFMTLGYRSLKHTERLIELAEKEGVDLIELGFPFSDPLADGPVIQASSYESLKRGTRFQDGLDLMKRLRKKGIQIPVLLFTYFNPLLNRGLEKAVRELHAAGFDGVLIPDLPPEEGEDFHRTLRSRGLSMIYFLAPTSTPERIRLVARKTDEFIYYVSSRGVTGARKTLDKDLKQNIQKIRRLTRKPVVVGFGISDKKTVAAASQNADGVIVGSAFIRALKAYGASPEGLRKTGSFIRLLKSGLRAK